MKGRKFEMDKAIKKEAYTRAGKLTVDASEKGGRKAVPSTISSISYKSGVVKENFSATYINSLGDMEFEALVRRVRLMSKLKRAFLYALLAICIAGAVMSSLAVVQMFIAGGAV